MLAEGCIGRRWNGYFPGTDCVCHRGVRSSGRLCHVKYYQADNWIYSQRNFVLIKWTSKSRVLLHNSFKRFFFLNLWNTFFFFFLNSTWLYFLKYLVWWFVATNADKHRILSGLGFPFGGCVQQIPVTDGLTAAASLSAQVCIWWGRLLHRRVSATSKHFHIVPKFIYTRSTNKVLKDSVKILFNLL